MKRTIILVLIVFTGVKLHNINAQNVSEVITEYSQTEGGSIGKERCYFKLTNGKMLKTIVINGVAKTDGWYGPLKLERTAYDDRGYYVVEYVPDIEANAMNWRYFQNNMRSYRYFYDRNGGDVTMIAEIKIFANKSYSIKRFYTNKGYDGVISATKSSSNGYELKESNFDINDVVINSTTLNQIMSKINFSFEQNGEKRVSNDGNHVTVGYKNSSLIMPLISYTRNGDITQIIFIMPIANSHDIGKELIKRFGTKYVNGEEVIQRGDLTYGIMADGIVGGIVIYRSN